MRHYVVIKKRSGAKNIAAFNLRDLLKAKQHFKKEVQFIGPFETRLEAQIEEMCR